jgi:hypothetical protein
MSMNHERNTTVTINKRLQFLFCFVKQQLILRIIKHFCKSPALNLGIDPCLNRRESPKTKVILLDSGKIVFLGSVSDFQQSDSPIIMELLALDPHDHTTDPYFPDPWDKKRRPKEEIL